MSKLRFKRAESNREEAAVYALGEWVERRLSLYGELYYKQKLVSASFPVALFPMLDEVMEAMVVIYAKRLGTISAVGAAMGVSPHTIRRWMIIWDGAGE